MAFFIAARSQHHLDGDGPRDASNHNIPKQARVVQYITAQLAIAQ